MKLDETKITAAGVLRCCLQSVGREHLEKDVFIGDKSTCEFCGEAFTLADKTDHPTWVPDWQIKA